MDHRLVCFLAYWAAFALTFIVLTNRRQWKETKGTFSTYEASTDWGVIWASSIGWPITWLGLVVFGVTCVVFYTGHFLCTWPGRWLAGGK